VVGGLVPVQAAAGDAGLFGPGSMAWRIDGEAVVLAGGTCALLMQLAHPAVAAGVAQHSDFRADPFARLRRTLDASYAVVFGTAPQADAALRRMNAIHGSVNGRIPGSGVAYSATDPQLLLWVHATLVDTAIRVYDRYVAPLSAAEQQAYHAEARQIAVRLGVPEDGVPMTLVELRAEMARLVADGTIAVSDTARSLAPSILHPSAFPPRVAWDAAHLISLSVMPDPIRRGYGIRWSPRREAGLRRLASVSRRLLPMLPDALRRVPQARSAERRVADRARR
jgi:uncharacterized protein (DUF2236 family)